VLKIESLHVTIASVQALRGFSLEVAAGSMVGLVGRNGAGKTSLIRTVMGHLSPSTGSVRFDGADLARQPKHARARLGIGYMPEDRGLVPELTVEENILVPIWASKTLKADERDHAALRHLEREPAQRLDRGDRDLERLDLEHAR
jgi:branched-chain amino acid transport system ATP-binding protein